MDATPLFSIITVTYNAGEKVLKTIESVYEQSFTNYEYILVDGASEDDTVHIIDENQEKFDNKCISYNYISEKDNGIYEAMNKSISMAKGKWVCFLNAGDLFYDSETLQTISKAIEAKNGIDIVYGDTIEFKANGLSIYRKALPIDQIVQAIPFFHQSCVTQLNLLKQYKFDLRYRICADYDFFLKCYLNKAYFEYIENPLSRYEYGGLSSCEENEMLLLREQLEIRTNQKIFDEMEYEYRLSELNKYMRYRLLTARIKRYIPNFLIEKRIYRKNKQNGWVFDNGK